MYELYVSETCPYSVKVMNYFNEHNIPYIKKLVSDYANMEELIELGGMHQVPFLYDPDEGTKMYESNDIINYVSKRR